MKRETLSKTLLNHADKLALTIGRAGNLPGFSDPRNHPDQWYFFCGKPGAELFTSGPISSDFFIPFDLILKLSKSDINDRVIKEREQLLKDFAGNHPARQ